MRLHELQAILAYARRVRSEFQLDLTGLNILTEAATGPFAVTAPLAALSGARVFAVVRSNRFSSRANALAETRKIASKWDVTRRITYLSDSSEAPLSEVDLVTNSGNVRPLNLRLLRSLPPTAVVSLMVEPWEVRTKDVDLPAIRQLGLAVAGVNERGKKVDLFRNLGPLLLAVLKKHSIPLDKRTVHLLCSNPFRPYLVKSLRAQGSRLTKGTSKADLVVIATGPFHQVTKKNLTGLARGTTIVQLWGDVSARGSQYQWLPPTRPARGHMGYLLSDLGPQPAVRLIAAGLKVGQILAQARKQGRSSREATEAAVRSGFALHRL